MRWIALLALVGLVACGDGEGDCYEEIPTRSGSVCLPDPVEGEGLCIVDPIYEPCTGMMDGRTCGPEEVLVLDTVAIGGEYLFVCDCWERGSTERLGCRR